MNQIINGKKYDTETAEYVAKDESSLGRGDFSYYYEELYRKKTGEFFLYGEGNAASNYSQACQGGYTGGAKIIPLTLEEAKKWCERVLTTESYEEVFGEVEE